MSASTMNPAIEAVQRFAAVETPGCAEYPASGNVRASRNADAAAIFITNSLRATDPDQTLIRLRDPYFSFELI